MEIWRKFLTKIYLLLRPEFLMIGKSKESKEGNSYYLDCVEKEYQKGIGTLERKGPARALRLALTTKRDKHWEHLLARGLEEQSTE